MAENTLIVPFLTDDPLYAYGVELGLLYARMRDGGEDMIEGYFLTWNQEQITLLTNRTGWRVVEMKVWDEDERWFWCKMERVA